MIGIVIIGHDGFASGMMKTVEMVAGIQPQLTFVDFTKEMSPELLNEKIRELIKEVDLDKGVVLFTDLKGGTPFNQAVLASVGYDNVRVITGTNVAMVIEGSLVRLEVEEVDELIEQLLHTGKSQIETFVVK